MRLSTVAGPLLAIALSADARAVGKRVIGRPGKNETTSWGAKCREFIIPATVTKSVDVEISMEDYNLNILFSLIGREILVDGSYELSARYCQPPKGAPRKDELVYLAHGATFSKDMWDFQFDPETYSWTRYLTRAGYSTLAVDFLGSGNSSHPHGLLEAQTQTLVVNTHDILQSVRSGDLLGKKFSKIAYVGFSLGGMVGNSLAQKHPEDFDTLIMLGVGWSKTYIYPAFMAGLQSAASGIDPERWGEFDDFYQTQSTPAAREAANFAGSYDPAVLAEDYRTRDLDTLGIAISFGFHLVPAPEFKKPVFLGMGGQDVFFCGQKCTDEPYAVYQNFPSASEYTIKVYESTGHAIHAHRAAPRAIRDVRDFLDWH